MVSKASDDFPDPDRPVMTTRRFRGISTSMFLRLWTRAPRTAIQSCAMNSVSFLLGFSNLHHNRSASRDIVRHSMRGQLFRTKSLDAILREGETPQHQLKRALGAFDV